jgi:hypothetical protein
MCVNCAFIDKLRSLLSEFHSRRESAESVERDGGSAHLVDLELERRSVEQVYDHRELCASIEGCDTTR